MSILALQMQEGMHPITKCQKVSCQCTGCPQIRDWVRNSKRTPPKVLLDLVCTMHFICKLEKCYCFECPNKMKKVYQFLDKLKNRLRNDESILTIEDMDKELVDYLDRVIVYDLNKER